MTHANEFVQDLVAIAQTLGVPKVEDKDVNALTTQLSKLERKRKILMDELALSKDEESYRDEIQKITDAKMRLRSTYVKANKELFKKFMVRRTHASRNSDGNDIIALPNYKYYSFKVPLSDEEMIMFSGLKRDMQKEM